MLSDLWGWDASRENAPVIDLSQNIQGNHVMSKNWDQALKQSPATQTLVQVVLPMARKHNIRTENIVKPVGDFIICVCSQYVHVKLPF